ncbi:MAG TPA: hypothetical protein VK112_03575 [Fodinibius sp.]|nr:hypothetical protein [Fodinibius sp.]
MSWGPYFVDAVFRGDATGGAELLARYHQRGAAELNHRALKQFGTERLPFQAVPIPAP